MTDSVPTMSGRTPKLAGLKSGAQSVPNRKSPIGTSSKKSMLGPISATRIAIVVRTESSAQPNSAPRMTPSPHRRLETVSRRTSGAPAPAAMPPACDPGLANYCGFAIWSAFCFEASACSVVIGTNCACSAIVSALST